MQEAHTSSLASAARRDYGRDRTGRRRRSHVSSRASAQLMTRRCQLGRSRRRARHVVGHRLEREIVERDQHDLGLPGRELGGRRRSSRARHRRAPSSGADREHALSLVSARSARSRARFVLGRSSPRSTLSAMSAPLHQPANVAVSCVLRLAIDPAGASLGALAGVARKAPLADVQAIHAVALHRGPHVRRHRAEILAGERAGRAPRFEREDREQILGGIAQVDAVGRGRGPRARSTAGTGPSRDRCAACPATRM